MMRLLVLVLILAFCVASWGLVILVGLLWLIKP